MSLPRYFHVLAFHSSSFAKTTISSRFHKKSCIPGHVGSDTCGSGHVCACFTTTCDFLIFDYVYGRPAFSENPKTSRFPGHVGSDTCLLALGAIQKVCHSQNSHSHFWTQTTSPHVKLCHIFSLPTSQHVTPKK